MLNPNVRPSPSEGEVASGGTGTMYVRLRANVKASRSRGGDVVLEAGAGSGDGSPKRFSKNSSNGSLFGNATVECLGRFDTGSIVFAIHISSL